MATQTDISGIPVPVPGDSNDVPRDIGALADYIDGAITRKLSAAGIAALTNPERPAGTAFWDTTNGKLKVSTDGAGAYGTVMILPDDTWQDYTPTVTDGGGASIAVTVRFSRYVKIGRWVNYLGHLTLNAGGASGPARASLPVSPVAIMSGGVDPVEIDQFAGTLHYSDVSAGSGAALPAYLMTSGLFPVGVSGFSVPIPGVSDGVAWSVIYRAAS